MQHVCALMREHDPVRVGMTVAHSGVAFDTTNDPAPLRSVFLNKEISIMLWTILVILLVLWLIGLLSNVGGSLIHLLLVVAVVVLIINLVTGRRAV